MAVIVPGPIVADIRGKCGANTFSRNQGGLYVKANPVWTQPPSEFRDVTQAALRDLTPLWSSQLNEPQRQGWRAYAARNPRPNRWGHRTLHNGYAFWVRANIYTFREDRTTPFTTPPQIPPTGPISWSVVRGTDPDFYDMTIAAQWYPPTDRTLWYFLYDQLPSSLGTTGTRGPWRYLGYNAADIPSQPETFAWSPAWPLAANQHRAIKLIAQWYPSGAFASTSWRQITT
jgi:hypothetical protein